MRDPLRHPILCNPQFLKNQDLPPPLLSRPNFQGTLNFIAESNLVHMTQR